MKDYRHILLPADVMHLSEPVGVRAVQLATHYGARITLLYVLEHFPEDIPVTPVGPQEQDPQTALVARAYEKLIGFVKQIGCEDAQRVVVPSMHSAKREILEFAHKRQIDLIVVGAHARHGIAKLLGSTAMGLVHGAECDVLMVRIPS